MEGFAMDIKEQMAVVFTKPLKKDDFFVSQEEQKWLVKRILGHKGV